MSVDEIESDVEETTSQLSLSSSGAIMHAHEQPSYNDVLQPSNSNVAVRLRPPSTTQTGSIQNFDSSSDEQSNHVSQLHQSSSSSNAAVRQRQPRTAHVARPIQYFDSSSESETDVGYYNRQVHTEAVKKRVRRKVRSEKDWARNIRKHRRNKGLSYTSIGGKEVCARKMGHGCPMKCRYKCKTHVDEETRRYIFDTYWKSGDINVHRQFIVGHVDRKVTGKPTRNTQESRRQLSFSYRLSCDDAVYTVCKTFFLDTLGIKEDIVYGAFNKKGSTGIVAPDMRGKHRKHRSVSNEDKELIRKHIASFKTVESHYCRKKSDRHYLPSELSITRLYNMYKEKCSQQDKIPQRECIYRKIFNHEFNLHFFKPKKDQCDFCAEYQNTEHKSAALEKQYKVHCTQKTLARQVKADAKEAAKIDSSMLAVCFDLEKVLNCPHGEMSSYYYHRKLSLYNLTMYSLGSGDVYCYLWNETQACDVLVNYHFDCRFISRICFIINAFHADFCFISINIIV